MTTTNHPPVALDTVTLHVQPPTTAERLTVLAMLPPTASFLSFLRRDVRNLFERPCHEDGTGFPDAHPHADQPEGRALAAAIPVAVRAIPGSLAAAVVTFPWPAEDVRPVCVYAMRKLHLDETGAQDARFVPFLDEHAAWQNDEELFFSHAVYRDSDHTFRAVRRALIHPRCLERARERHRESLQLRNHGCPWGWWQRWRDCCGCCCCHCSRVDVDEVDGGGM